MRNNILLIFLVILSAGCSTSYSMNGGSVPAEAKTFSVEYFTVRAPGADPNYGQLITEELKDLLLRQTRLGLTDGSGDIQYEGEISRYDVIPVAASGEEISTRSRLTIDVKLTFINLIEPEKDKEITLTQYEDFDSANDFSVVEQNLLELINEKILQDIFDRTLGDW